MDTAAAPSGPARSAVTLATASRDKPADASIASAGVLAAPPAPAPLSAADLQREAQTMLNRLAAQLPTLEDASMRAIYVFWPAGQEVNFALPVASVSAEVYLLLQADGQWEVRTQNGVRTPPLKITFSTNGDILAGQDYLYQEYMLSTVFNRTPDVPAGTTITFTEERGGKKASLSLVLPDPVALASPGPQPTFATNQAPEQILASIGVKKDANDKFPTIIDKGKLGAFIENLSGLTVEICEAVKITLKWDVDASTSEGLSKWLEALVVAAGRREEPDTLLIALQNALPENPDLAAIVTILAPDRLVAPGPASTATAPASTTTASASPTLPPVATASARSAEEVMIAMGVSLESSQGQAPTLTLVNREKLYNYLTGLRLTNSALERVSVHTAAQGSVPTVDDLVAAAERNGTIDNLIIALHWELPENEELKSVVAALGRDKLAPSAIAGLSANADQGQGNKTPSFEEACATLGLKGSGNDLTIDTDSFPNNMRLWFYLLHGVKLSDNAISTVAAANDSTRSISGSEVGLAARIHELVQTALREGDIALLLIALANTVPEDPFFAAVNQGP